VPRGGLLLKVERGKLDWQMIRCSSIALTLSVCNVSRNDRSAYEATKGADEVAIAGGAWSE